ncbi:carboxypeptidase-like regulatory domain-containing protein [Mucilaginibacter sp. HD30]
MDSKNADILQIKKYLEGKLDTRAMYELERRALNDPLLMDAMEGFEAAGNQDKAIAELAANLHNRLQRPKARIISFSTLAMAASVIVVLGVGGWWLMSGPVVNKAEVGAQLQADNTEVAPSPLIKDPQIAINKDSLIAFNAPRNRAVIRSPRRSYYNGSASNNYDVPVTADETAEIASSAVQGGNLNEVALAAENTRVKKDSVPFNEMVVVAFGRQKKQEKVGAYSDPLKDQIMSAAKAASATVVSATIKGKVVSEDGQPLPGVTVRAGNNANSTFTDKDGAYTLNVDSLNTNISYKYIGYRPRTIDAKDAPSKVTLEPDAMMLNEVVIAKPDGTQPDAQPKYGWENFQKYLNANSVLPNGKTGSSRVSFTVGKDGTLSDFEISKTDDDMAGQKAVQLIKNGPEWVGSPQGQPKKITVTVKFHKPEK